jgi:NADH:ubiquinone oxidoreductase subunit K
MITTNHNEGFIQPRIVRGQVDSLSLFEITDYELEVLEQGAPNAIFLNFAVFFISIALSFLITLMTVTSVSTKTFIVFVVFTVVGFAVGGVLLVLWYRTRSKISVLVQKIKARVPMVSADTETGELTASGQETEVSAG